MVFNGIGTFELPIAIIAQHFAHLYNDNIVESMQNDTYPIFFDNHSEIIKWLQGNKSWKDICEEAIPINIEELHYHTLDSAFNNCEDIVIFNSSLSPD